MSRQLIQSAPPRQLANRIGSRITLLMSVFRPWPNESMSLVNRVISSEEPWSEKLARSRLIVRRKNMLRMSNSVSCITIGNEDFLEEHEEALQGHPEHHQPDQQHQALEALVWQVPVDIGLGGLVPKEDLRRSLFSSAISRIRREIPGAALIEQPPAFP